MAGSHAKAFPPKFEDPILSARLEAVRLLADHLREPVVVVDRSCNIIYANRSACAGNKGALTSEAPAKCYAAFFRRSEPCSLCPARDLFETCGPPSASPVSDATGRGDTSSGVIHAFPLMSADKTVTYVLEILKLKGVSQGEAAAASSPSDTARLGGLIGRSEVMRQVCEMIRLVADSQATVLLQGESGTGKELVARTIHKLSSRRNRPFVVVDCGSLPESLLESELFGHVKGAFTGAVSSKKGLFEEADGGTVFLDEIADTTAHFQSKLLRALQEGEIKPVGSSRSIKVHVRIISASNKNLLELVKARAFRGDLYYRLAVLPLYLPPLRERREDIPLLVNHFVEASCKRHRKPLRTITAETMQALVDAPWPGNIRELQHMIERVVVTASGPELTRQDFFGSSAIVTPVVLGADLRRVARDAAQLAERAHIEAALRESGGIRAKAARALAISRASLYNKLRAYGIE